MKNLFLILAFFAVSCKKDLLPVLRVETTYVYRCGLVTKCEVAQPVLSSGAYYKLLVDYNNGGPREIKYANRPYVKGEEFCYYQPN